MPAYNSNLIDKILRALECAKEAHDLLPPLPPDIKHVYIRILNALYQTCDESGNARVSDINNALGFSLPNTTRYLSELDHLKIIEKNSSDYDKRVVLVRMTDLGEKYFQKFVAGIHGHLAEEFASINETDLITMIETINKVYRAMKKVYREERNIDVDE